MMVWIIIWGAAVLIGLAAGAVSIALCKDAAKGDDINRNNEGNLNG